MESNSILTANILDIVFEGRNKEYGAYDLRKNYSRRMSAALGINAVVIMIFIGAVIAGSTSKGEEYSSRIIEIPPPTHLPPKEVIPEPPKPMMKEPIKTLAFPPPVIVIDKLFIDPPVENDKLTDVTIDTRTVEGKIDDRINIPVEIKNSLVIEVPTKTINEGEPFLKVEIEAKFNGNWNAYVKKAIEKNIDELTEAGVSGTCVVKFVVSKDGSVSEVEALTMKGTKLAEIAVNAIRNGPKWIPAQQNNTIVNAYRHQPITFTIQD